MEMTLSFVGSLILVICVLVSVAFLTLLECKVLGYIQIRKGPNSVGLMEIPQPFCDSIKLFTKEQTYPLLSNYVSYYFFPIFSLFISLIVWLCVPLFVKLFSFNLGILLYFFLCCTSLGVYAVMVAGWSSNSNYALLGGLRAVAQTISYEVSMALVLLSFVLLIGSYNILDFFYYQNYIWFVVIIIIIIIPTPLSPPHTARGGVHFHRTRRHIRDASRVGTICCLYYVLYYFIVIYVEVFWCFISTRLKST